MNKHHTIYLALILVGLVIVLPSQALASIGKVNFAYGPVTATDNSGQARSIRKGSDLNQGDLIDTKSGRAQLKFNDGGYISLQPNTQFRIDEYRFNRENAKEDRGIFSLIKGGLRALTGLIGKTDKKSYQLNTPMVTIGIRGTGYTAMVNDDGTTVGVGEGAIIMSNDKGAHVVNAWQSGQVKPGEAPGPAVQRPYLPLDAIPTYTPEYSISDERDANGTPLVLTSATSAQLESGPGYNMALVVTQRPAVGPSIASTTTANTTTATFNDTSELLAFSGQEETGSVPTPISSDVNTGSVVDSGTDGTLGWGRWTSGFTPISALPEDNLHYIVGLAPATMPTTGTATYTSYVYTAPTTTSDFTNNDGTFQNLASTLAVDFAGSTVDMNIDLNYSANTYNLVTNNPATISGSNFITGTVFNGIDANNGTFSGFFAGDNASHAGTSYQFATDDGNVTTGVVGYTRN